MHSDDNSNLDNFISVPKYLWGMYFLFPLIVCFVQYGITLFAVYVFFSELVTPWVMTMCGFYFLFSLSLILFWYRTFFDKSFVGAGHLLYANWCESKIQFRGAFFNITLPYDNIRLFIVDNERNNKRGQTPFSVDFGVLRGTIVDYATTKANC